MSTKRMIIMLLACLAVFGGVFGMKYMGGKAMSSYFDNMPSPAVTVLSSKVQSMRWTQSIPTVGNLVPHNGTNLTTQVAGIVDGIHFVPGSQAKQGELLVSLDARIEKAELKQLKAQAEIARSNQRRADDLYRRKVLSQAEYDRTRAEAAAADAAVDAQQARVEHKDIRAPFDGVLGIRQINVGEYLTPGTALVSLQALDPMEVEFALPENQQSQVSVGLPVKISVDAWPDSAFEGRIQVIEPAIDLSTRNMILRAQIPNPNAKLRAGMFAKVRIEKGTSIDVLAIPRTALKYDSYGTSVFVIAASEDDPEKLVATNRFIRIGQVRGDFVEVLEGLQTGDEVAAGGLLKLRNGSSVIIDNSVSIKPSLNPSVADS
ncbi:MAG: efflux RND transporter periplasmic adaptor subunit [Oceanococcus sp.]